MLVPTRTKASQNSNSSETNSTVGSGFAYNMNTSSVCKKRCKERDARNKTVTFLGNKMCSYHQQAHIGRVAHVPHEGPRLNTSYTKESIYNREYGFAKFAQTVEPPA